MTSLQFNVFLKGIYRLLVTNKGPSPFLIANHCQGQIKNSTVTVCTLAYKSCDSVVCVVATPQTEPNIVPKLEQVFHPNRIEFKELKKESAPRHNISAKKIKKIY